MEYVKLISKNLNILQNHAQNHFNFFLESGRLQNLHEKPNLSKGIMPFVISIK